ncbi:hypothetical protein LV779_39250 [Streptomyces thinghirensis]|nr:hypothetical protein [Streptomyces thinghirensis]
MEEHRTPPAEPVAPDTDQHSSLSAKSEDRLRAYATGLAAFLRGTRVRPASAGRDALGDASGCACAWPPETVGVAAGGRLNLGTDLADCGFGVPGRARLERR